VLANVIQHLPAVANRLLNWVRSAIREATPPLPTLAGLLVDITRSREQLLLENTLLRQQLIVASRKIKRPMFKAPERGFVVLLASLLPHWRNDLLRGQARMLGSHHHSRATPPAEGSRISLRYFNTGRPHRGLVSESPFQARARSIAKAPRSIRCPYLGDAITIIKWPHDDADRQRSQHRLQALAVTEAGLDNRVTDRAPRTTPFCEHHCDFRKNRWALAFCQTYPSRLNSRQRPRTPGGPISLGPRTTLTVHDHGPPGIGVRGPSVA